MSYQDQVAAVKDKYAERIVAVLNRIRDMLQAVGYTVDEPWDMSGDDFSWAMLVHISSGPDDSPADDDVDIRFQIAESEQFEGTEDGINFTLDIVTVGGRILGGLSPYNYTPDVWVNLDDADAVEARFAIFEEADPESILDLLPSLTS